MKHENRNISIKHTPASLYLSSADSRDLCCRVWTRDKGLALAVREEVIDTDTKASNPKWSEHLLGRVYV